MKENITKDLIEEIFKQGGCTPDRRDDDSYGITYKNIYIVVQTNEGHHSVTLYDLHWFKASKFDIDKMLHIKKEINSINSIGGIKLVTNNFDDDYCYVSSALTIPFIAEIPNVGNYLRQQLDALLSYRQVFLQNADHNSNNI